jgi:hypothetical protein
METLERIDRYLDRELIPEEALGLERNLQTDSEFQNLFDRVLVSRDVVRASALRKQVRTLHLQLLDEVRQQQEETEQPDTTIVRPLWHGFGQSVRWGMRVAASGLLLLAGYGSYQYASTSIDTYYSAKFLDYQLPATRGTNEWNSTLDELYRAGNYGAITQRFSKLSAQTPHDQFLTGMAHLHQHQYGQAIVQFKRIRQRNREQGSALFEQETDYYLALAYLGNGRIADAYPLFELIRDTPRHLYHQNVTEGDLWKLSLLRWKSN